MYPFECVILCIENVCVFSPLSTVKYNPLDLHSSILQESLQWTFKWASLLARFLCNMPPPCKPLLPLLVIVYNYYLFMTLCHGMITWKQELWVYIYSRYIPAPKTVCLAQHRHLIFICWMTEWTQSHFLISFSTILPFPCALYYPVILMSIWYSPNT